MVKMADLILGGGVCVVKDVKPDIPTDTVFLGGFMAPRSRRRKDGTESLSLNLYLTNTASMPMAFVPWMAFRADTLAEAVTVFNRISKANGGSLGARMDAEKIPRDTVRPIWEEEGRRQCGVFLCNHSQIHGLDTSETTPETGVQIGRALISVTFPAEAA